MTRDDTPAIHAAIRQAQENPRQPVTVAETGITVTWLPGTRRGCATLMYGGAGTLYLGEEGGKLVIEERGVPDPALIWDLP